MAHLISQSFRLLIQHKQGISGFFDNPDVKKYIQTEITNCSRLAEVIAILDTANIPTFYQIYRDTLHKVQDQDGLLTLLASLHADEERDLTNLANTLCFDYFHQKTLDDLVQCYNASPQNLRPYFFERLKAIDTISTKNDLGALLADLKRFSGPYDAIITFLHEQINATIKDKTPDLSAIKISLDDDWWSLLAALFTHTKVSIDLFPSELLPQKFKQFNQLMKTDNPKLLAWMCANLPHLFDEMDLFYQEGNTYQKEQIIHLFKTFAKQNTTLKLEKIDILKHYKEEEHLSVLLTWIDWPTFFENASLCSMSQALEPALNDISIRTAVLQSILQYNHNGPQINLSKTNFYQNIPETLASLSCNELKQLGKELLDEWVEHLPDIDNADAFWQSLEIDKFKEIFSIASPAAQDYLTKFNRLSAKETWENLNATAKATWLLKDRELLIKTINTDRQAVNTLFTDKTIQETIRLQLIANAAIFCETEFLQHNLITVTKGVLETAKKSPQDLTNLLLAIPSSHVKIVCEHLQSLDTSITHCQHSLTSLHYLSHPGSATAAIYGDGDIAKSIILVSSVIGAIVGAILLPADPVLGMAAGYALGMFAAITLLPLAIALVIDLPSFLITGLFNLVTQLCINHNASELASYQNIYGQLDGVSKVVAELGKIKEPVPEETVKSSQGWFNFFSVSIPSSPKEPTYEVVPTALQ